MKYIVAVSGGVDSVVLLDMLSRGDDELVVAHFDHGIRVDSAADARFVAALAEKYGLNFEAKREELGKYASEETARNRRYEFLNEIAIKHSGKIVTAHHADDVIESIAINLKRGSGWRGLAVLGSADIYRPLLRKRKKELYDYALTHNLEWAEDETNSEDRYLRNQLRRRLGAKLPAAGREALLHLWQQQSNLKKEIENEISKLSASLPLSSRYVFTHINEEVASELLRFVLHSDGFSLTRPQRLRLLHAIKTAKPGTRYQAGGEVEVGFTAREFIVKRSR